MNKQFKSKEKRGIEWCDYTHNPIAGCFHACQWEMPDGKIANCYAEDVADRVAGRAYPQGFEHHYFKPEIINEPLKVKTPSKIFLGSMADNLGHWVPDEQVQALIDMCREAHWHTMQWLTKNPVRAKHFDWPDNCWIGTSSPPDFMWNKRLSENQMERMLFRALDSFDTLDVSVRWMSIEPLSYDIGAMFERWIEKTGKRLPLEWAVIGAASNGTVYYQPHPSHLINVLQVLDKYGVKVFFKGNLTPSYEAKVLSRWREDFPAITPPTPPTVILEGVKVSSPAPTPSPTTVVSFHDVKEHWDGLNQKWDDPKYVYIGRYNDIYGLGESIWANPFKVSAYGGESSRGDVVAAYREFIKRVLETSKRHTIEDLRGKTLVCWCKDSAHPTRACHGDVILELLGEKSAEPETQPVRQLSLF